MNTGNLKVLMISTDRNIFAPGSAVSERMKEYGKGVKELHIVVLSDKLHGLKEIQLDTNVWVYPSNASWKLRRPVRAATLGKKIVYEKKFVRGQSLITTQDPFECGLAGLKIKKKWRLPLEVQLHTDPFSPYFTGFLNGIRKNIARKVLKHADSVRVVSENLKSEISQFTKSKISVLPIFVDVEQIEKMPVKFDLHARLGWNFIILCVARLTPEKNLGLALKTLALLQTGFPDAGLVIVGSGPEEGRLKSEVKSLKIDGNVSFEGWQSDLASYYKTANAFLQTSHFEGYGMALVEAGLSGLPVVTTAVGLAQEFEPGKEAYVFADPTPELLAQGIADLIEHNEKRENLRFNMKRFLESKLPTKDEYLRRMKTLWEETALMAK